MSQTLCLHVFGCALALLLLPVLLVAIRRLVFHPLAGVPGPRLAAVSNIWYAWHVRHGRMFELGRTLHRQYGPAVRVGPNEVWFDSPEAYKAIYGAGSGFEKSEFYPTLIKTPTISWSFTSWEFIPTYEDSLDLLSDRDAKRYRSQRRTIGPTYTLLSLRKHEPALDEAIRRVVDALHGLHAAETVDLKEWMHSSVVECLGAVVLGGWSPKFLQLKTDCGTSAHAHLIWRRKSVMGLFPHATMLGIMSKTLSRVFGAAWGIRHAQPPNHRPFFPAVQRKIAKRINAAMRMTSKPGVRTVDLLDELIQLHKSKPESFPVDYLRRMAMTNFGAGHETMTSAMISALAMIGTHPGVQARIHGELDAHVTGRELSYDHVQLLSYTIAAIKEAQRLYPAIGMSLPRVVPDAVPPLELHGHTFPPGTTVGCAPVALHRNDTIFGPGADTYRPDRWLEADPQTRNTMARVNLTYGGGARSCPGKHLAELIVYKLVATILREFEVVIDMPPEEDIQYYFLAMLTGTRARFIPRK